MFRNLELSTVMSIAAIIISLVSLVWQIIGSVLEKTERLKVNSAITNNYLVVT